MDELDDDQLLIRAAVERDAFAAFYRRYEAAVLAYFARRVGDPELAADLTAEVFAAVLTACRRYRPGGAPAQAWLFAIAHHKLAASLRRGRVEDRARRRLQMAPIAFADEDLERVAELTHDTSVVLRLLDELPAAQREAIIARVLDEHEYADIAGRLRCSQAVVRQRVSRGLSTLRQRLGDEHP